MGIKKLNKYSPGFKEQVVRRIVEDGMTATEVSKSLGIAKWAIYEWVSQARKKRAKPGKTASGGEHRETEREELRRLRKENERLRMEKEILKKAAAFFAKEDGEKS
jgi:transposase